MYLYLDLIWLLNFLIDYLLLWMTAMFRNINVKKWRLALAAGIGSMYVLFLFFPPIQPLYTFICKLLLSVTLVIIAFGFKSIHSFLLSFLMFYFVSFITGGGMMAAHFLLQSNHQLLQGMLATQTNGFGDRVSWLFVCIGFPIMYWFSRSRWKQMEATKLKTTSLSKVIISIKGYKVACSGLVDTGNQLYEPITGVPVMMIDANILSSFLPKHLLDIALNQDIGKFPLHSLEEKINEEWLVRVRIVPYQGVRQGMQLMLAIRPDQVEIEHENNIYISNKVLIGLNSQMLSKDGSYEAIVHPALLKNGQKEEVIKNAN